MGWCNKIMEHPTKILTDVNSHEELLATFGLFVEEFPTYSEIVNGTPKLSSIFKLSENFKINNSLIVGNTGFEPVTFAV